MEPRGLKEPEHFVEVALDESRPSERGRVYSELVLPRTEVWGGRRGGGGRGLSSRAADGHLG